MTVDEALQQLRQGGNHSRLGGALHETYPVATAQDVERTERAIGYRLPSSYVRFVREFSNGAYLFQMQEVSAVGDGNPQIAAIQHIERRKLDPDTLILIHEGGSTRYRYLVPFGLDSNSNEWCFIATDDSLAEYAVAYFKPYPHEELPWKLYGVLPDFEAWLTMLIMADGAHEVIRLLYQDNDDVLFEELRLG